MVHMLQLMMEWVIFDPCQIPLFPIDLLSLAGNNDTLFKGVPIDADKLGCLDLISTTLTAGKMQAQQEIIFFQS